MLPGNTKTARALRALALRNPGVEERIACKGTKLECATFGVGKQTFLFVGVDAAGSYLRDPLIHSSANLARVMV